MNKGFWLKILSFLVPALAAVVFLVWWLSPTQQVKRAAAALVDAAEVRVLTTETREERTERFVGLVTDPVKVAIEGEFSGELLDRDDLASAHGRLQSSVTSAQITVAEADIRFLAPDLAEFEAPMDVQLRLGQNFQQVYRFQTTLTFRKVGKKWLLSEVSAPFR